MRILIDTHCWLWWLRSPERLGSASRALLEDRKNTVFVSAVLSWEIAIKHSIGRLEFPEDPETFLPPRILRDGFTPLPIGHSHALRTAVLPYHHRDPFDRLLVAQAQVEDLPIMTSDAAIQDYDVAVIDPTE